MVDSQLPDMLCDLLGPEDPQVRSLRSALQNPGMRDAAVGLLHSLARERGLDPTRLPAFGFANDLDRGELVIARVKVADVLCQEIGLADTGKQPGHTLIAGRSKAGKTFLAKHIAVQAIRRGDKVLIFARDHEWRDLLSLFAPDRLLYLEPTDLGLNVFEVPSDDQGRRVMSPQDWVMELKVVFRGCLYLRDVSSNLFGKTLLDLYKNKGVFRGGDHPCLSELRHAVAGLSLGSGNRLREARDTLIDRLDMLIAFLPGLDVAQSRPVRRLFSHSIVLDVSALHETAYAFVFSFLAVLLKATFPGEVL